MIGIPSSATKKRDRLKSDSANKDPQWAWGFDPESDSSTWGLPKPSRLEQEFTTPPEIRESFGPDKTIQGTIVTKRTKMRVESGEHPIPRPLFVDDDDTNPGRQSPEWKTPSPASPPLCSLSPTPSPQPPTHLAVHFPKDMYCSSPGDSKSFLTRPEENKKKPSPPRTRNLTIQIPTKLDAAEAKESKDSTRSDNSYRGSISRGSLSGRGSVKFENLDFHEYDYHEDIAVLEDDPTFECMTPAATTFSPRDSTMFEFELANSPPSSVRSPQNFPPELSLSPRNPFSCTFRRDASGPSKRSSALSLVPESEAFVESQHLQRTSSQRKIKKKEPPPTPVAHRLARDNSLCDDKLLLTNFYTLSVTDPEDDNTGRIFATEFSNHKKIGSGAFFEVFRVEQARRGKIFAVKRSKKPFRSKRDRSEYLREIQMVSKLPLHKNIITYYRAWQEDLHFLIQMEYCRTNLNDFVVGKKLSDKFLWDCFHQIAQGLSHVHRGGLIHLDIKPENILVDYKPEALPRGQTVQVVYKLGDFGQARLKGPWADGSEGDAVYAAPEVISHKNNGCDPQTSADIFSLGLLMFELSTRYALPKNGELWHDIRAGSRSRELAIALDKLKNRDLRKLIMSCLEPEPTARPTAESVMCVCAAHKK